MKSVESFCHQLLAHYDKSCCWEEICRDYPATHFNAFDPFSKEDFDMTQELMKTSEIFNHFTKQIQNLKLQSKVAWDVEAARATLIIPAKNSETGDVVVFDDGDELTLVVGKHFHEHFGAPRFRGITDAVAGACEFIHDLLNDQIVVYVRIRDGQIRGGGACAPGDLAEINPEDKYFKWSGPFVPDR